MVYMFRSNYLDSFWRNSTILCSEISSPVVQLKLEKIYNLYCEHLGNVGNCVEKTKISSLQMISKATGELYVDEDESVETAWMMYAFASTILNSTVITPRQKR